MRIGCVVLTTGQRPAELAAALDSVRQQRGIEVEIVVVHNAPPDAPAPEPGDDVHLVRPGGNLGIPAGRNLGVRELGDTCELVLFLDDDGRLLGDDLLARAALRFDADPKLAAVSLRIVDPETGRTERRHVPRLRADDPERSSEVTTFLGGASILRRDAYLDVGGLPEAFFYAHEETSLAWRLLDAGWRIVYAGDLAMAHPAVAPSRHETYFHLTARNRVLLARQHLPVPINIVYVAVWAGITLLRVRSGLSASLRGFRDGLTMADVERTPMRWRTVWRMARIGRPPIV